MLAGLTGASISHAAEAAKPRIVESLEIREVPSDFPVGFCLLTAGNDQFVGYYDKDSNMTVASRKLGSDQWLYQILPSQIGSDSHNYIAMALDDDGKLWIRTATAPGSPPCPSQAC